MRRAKRPVGLSGRVPSRAFAARLGRCTTEEAATALTSEASVSRWRRKRFGAVSGVMREGVDP